MGGNGRKNRAKIWYPERRWTVPAEQADTHSVVRLQGGCAIGAREPRQVRKEATVAGYPM